MLGLQLGFSYDEGMAVPDGTPPPAPADGVAELVQTARPGRRMPHAWVEVAGRRVSSLDLVAAGTEWTLLAGAQGDAWIAAAGAVTRPSVRVIVASRDFDDPGDGWRHGCAIEPDGAVLVRPDQHVAWRSATSPGDPAGALASVFSSLCDPHG